MTVDSTELRLATLLDNHEWDAYGGLNGGGGCRCGWVYTSETAALPAPYGYARHKAEAILAALTTGILTPEDLGMHMAVPPGFPLARDVALWSVQPT